MRQRVGKKRFIYCITGLMGQFNNAFYTVVNKWQVKNKCYSLYRLKGTSVQFIIVMAQQASIHTDISSECN